MGFFHGAKKEVKISHIKKISERKMGLTSGRLRISGSKKLQGLVSL